MKPGPVSVCIYPAYFNFSDWVHSFEHLAFISFHYGYWTDTAPGGLARVYCRKSFTEHVTAVQAKYNSMEQFFSSEANSRSTSPVIPRLL
jgi:hypothetical protein